MSTSISASVSLISAAASASSATTATTTPATSSGLVQLANGEYTAASVATDPTDAAKLGLIKEKDGNYGTASTNQVAPPSAPSLSSGVQAALSTLTLGGT